MRFVNTNTKKLSGKVAVVTGASKGIGAAIAQALGAKGASVTVNYSSSRAGADRVVAAITKSDGRAMAVQTKVSQRQDIDRLFVETKRGLGHLDILVNNAGLYEFSPLEKLTGEHFHNQFNLNVLGLLLVSQAAARQFDGGGGSIINLSAIVSTLAIPDAAVFLASDDSPWITRETFVVSGGYR
jgi:3-oxoacyl-[acyl-carrier protein] reductase